MNIPVTYEVKDKVIIKTTDEKAEVVGYEYVYFRPIRYVLAVEWSKEWSYCYAEELVENKESKSIWFLKDS